MKPCIHLDYDSEFMDCTLETAAPHYPEVRFWRRGEVWLDNGPGQRRNPEKVQFCKLRGRVNAVFDCYQEGFLPCYEASSK